MVTKANGQKKTTSKKKQRRKPRVSDSGRPSLRILVTRGSITQVTAPVVAVGAYQGIAPTKSSALGVIDRAIDLWISRAFDQGLTGLKLGQVFFIPVPPGRIKSPNVLLAGMGNYGSFEYGDLRYLAMNVCFGVSALKMERFATVLIGSGEGNHSVEDAVKGLLSGTCDALHRLKPEERVSEMELVEFNPDRFEEILKILKRFEKEATIENLDISVKSRRFALPREVKTGKGQTRATARESERFVNRITIEHDDEGYAFSALTEGAVVPVRRIAVQKFFTDGITKQLRLSETEDRHKLGSLLHKYVFPEDFEGLISSNKPLTLVVDSKTAGLPWEMACFGPTANPTYFGVGLKLTRQFRTMLAGSPGIAPPINKSLRILVIANPAPEPELHLEKAENEGLEVLKALKAFKSKQEGKSDLEITIESRIGSAECNPIEVLGLILNGAFDIIHYAGHGVFDEEHPNSGGWVFGNDAILSASEIFKLRQVPRLVFANACFSAQCHNGETPSPRSSNRKLAGLAEAFFERGVQNYIGTGWEVDDASAKEFAQVFYKEAMAGELLGDALAVARKAIFDLGGSTWGAYQHYGHFKARVAHKS